MRRLLILLLLLTLPLASGLLQKHEFYIGEPVIIQTTNETGKVIVHAPSSDYRLLDTPGAEVPYIPNERGEHRVALIGPDGEELATDAFTVTEGSETVVREITIEPEIPFVGLEATIRITPPPTGNVRVMIRSPGGVFRYNGPWADAPFTPQQEGPHEIIIMEGDQVTARKEFVVGPPLPQIPDEPVETPAEIPAENLTIPSPDGNLTWIGIQDSDGKEVRAHMRVRNVREEGKRKYDVELTPDKVARRLTLHDVEEGQDVRVGLDEVPATDIDLGERYVERAYAVDLAGFNGTGELVVVARGRALYKCQAWNFTTQSCEGTWVKDRTLTPGTEYTILLSPGDPGFAETGVATVNSIKPIYLPGEEAEFLMVVLDTGGYLVRNASITLTVTAPDGTNATITGITETSRGVYYASYAGTSQEGNYTLLVDATAPGVHSVMESGFAVMADYPYDILRDMPVTTDPFQGPFGAAITIVPRSGPGEYNFTEVLPAEFGIVDASGATITGDSANTYLTWTGLTGSATVNYTAQPPLRTPTLFALGKAFVTYVQDGVVKVFEEFRAWFLAIDPEVTRDMGLVVYGDRSPDGSIKFRNWTGTLLQGEQDSGLDVGDRTTWFRFRCLEARGECLLLMSDGGNDLNFAVFDVNTWTWRNSTQLDGNIGQDDQMQFDVECMDTSGDCLIAYEDATTGNNNFQARIWNASGLQAASAVTVPGGESNDFQWLELYPQKGSDQIGIALQNDGGGANTDTPAIYAAIWNGTAFGNWGNLTTVGPAQGNGRTFFKHFDCAWEGNASRFICFYGENNLNGVDAKRWNSTAWVDLGTIYSATGDEVLEFAACGQEPWSDFSHDYVGLFFCDDAADLDGGVWNGTALSKAATATTPAVNTNAECGSNKAVDEWGRDFECRWEHTGDQAVFVWVAASNQDWLTAGTYTKSTDSFSMANWSTGTQIVADAAGNQRMVQLIPNQADDTMFLVYADASSDGGCSDWTGSSWDGTGCNSQLVFETSGARPSRQWLTFDWFRTPPPQPDIIIYRPNGTHSDVTFSGVLNPSSTSTFRENTTTTALPPAGTSAPLPGTEVPSAAYVNVSASDDTYRHSVVSGAGGLHATQIFNFSVLDSPISMSEIVLTHEGRATQAVSPAASNLRIYIYNWTSDTYVLEKTAFASAVDVLSEVSITSGFTDYVRYRQMLVLLEGEFATGAGGNARAEIITDYIGLSIDSIAVLRGNVTVNASAEDDDGIGFCEWRPVNVSNGVQVGSFSPLPLNATPYYVNVNDSALYPDGTYDLTVFCNDTLANRRNATERVRIDNTPPNIILYTPENATNLSASSAIFSWNVTDISGENMLCNVTIATTVSATNVVSPHGENNTRNITGMTDGPKNWSVRCFDDAGNSNTSAMWNFTVDTRPPALTLVNPTAGRYLNDSTVNFTYTPSDANGLLNCTLTLDNVNNMTTYGPASGVTTNFTVEGVAQGIHWWNITCFDIFAKTNLSATRNFTVDLGFPSVVLNTSNGITFNNTPAVLNFTAYDNIDTNLTCNITVNDTVVAQNIGGPNGTLVSRNVTLLDGDKAWNVTCVDDAGNINISQTRFFRVVGGPTVTNYLPRNASVNSGVNVNFTYFAQDGDGIANCSLVVDDLINLTATTIANGANNSFIGNLTEGSHQWYVNCTDSGGTAGYGSTWTVTADKTPPNIVLNLPSPGQVLQVTPTLLNFTMVDTLSPNATCNLTIDGAVNAANMNFVMQNNTLTTRSQTIINGIHYWNVTCYDLGGNGNISLTRNFTVNATFPLNVTVLTDKILYQEGEIILVNITVRNETRHAVAANGTMDYIFTNTTITSTPWWNTSWHKRQPISINETSNVARNGKPVMVNVTGLYGGISSCTQEIRVVRDSDLTEVAFNVIQGDDVTYCTIQFNATVAANRNNQQDYHVYYNNSAATNPGYENITRIVTLFTDAFNNNANWNANAGWDTSTGDPLAGNHAHVDGSVTNANLSLATALNLSRYDTVNLTYQWGIDNTWDAGEYITLHFSNNSGSTWSANLSGLFGSGGAFDLVTTFAINSTSNAAYKVDGFMVRFRANVSAGTEDGGVDNMNVSAQDLLQNVSAWSGQPQTWLQRNTTDTSSTGNYSLNLTTLGRIPGNYSVVARYTSPTGLNSPGNGSDWFRIVADVFGPAITIIQPVNGTTNHSGQITFIYQAYDAANQVANCTITIDGLVNGTNETAINETGNNTHLANLTEGRHTWQVNCTDTLGNNASSNVTVFFLDDTPPTITDLAPNGTTLGSSNITFSFNASDNLDTLLQCSINLSGATPRNISVNATNSSNTSITATNLSEGDYAWNVTCWDNINNTFTTGLANFSTNSIPIVNLFSPANGYGVNATDITLSYNVTETSLLNCTLYINGTANASNSTPLLYTNNDGNNNFTLSGMAYGRYNWTVVCFDTSGFNGTSATRRFQLDNDLPSITRNRPTENETLYTTTVVFNWTVVDTDPFPLCNLTVDGSANRTNISANESRPTLVSVGGFVGGNHNWSVTCWDAAGFTSTTETGNFSIDTTVSVTLVSPANNSIDGDGSVSFTYIPQSVSGFTLGYCDLYLDGVSNATHIGLISGNQDTFTVGGIVDGAHAWYVNCTNSVGVSGWSATWNFIMDLQDPVVTGNSPNGTIVSSTVTFNWTATDNLDLNLTCNVRVNGTLRTPGNIVSPNGSWVNATYTSFTDGYHIWNVTCTDDGQRNGTSGIKNFTVVEPPLITLNTPANANRTANTTIRFYYTPRDNSNNLSNCTILLDDIANATNATISHNAQNNFTIAGIPEGNHHWNVSCIDPSGNQGMNLSGRNFTIDLTPPNIILNRPPNASAIAGNNATLNWTPVDTSALTIVCNVSVTNGTAMLNRSNIAGANGSNFTWMFPNLIEGPHNWSVTCVDDVGNRNTSETYVFYVNQADLQTNDTQLSVNSTNPALGETILIRANVTNLGGVSATNFVVSFWDGLPGIGVFIANATSTLASNQSAIVSAAWNVTEGYHTLWVVIDPDDAFSELDETNNNGSLNISAILANITAPPNATVTADNTTQVSFNITDYTAGWLNYTIFVDGTANGQNGTVLAGQGATIDITPGLNDGYRRIIVQANDSLGRKRNSTTLTLIIDTTPPAPAFVTRNGTFYATASPIVTIRINDTLDIDINYTIYVNGTANATGNVTNATNANATLSVLTNGTYGLTLEGFDWVGNIANGTPIVIYVDSVPPNITLNAPADGAPFGTRAVTLNYTPSDNLDPVLECNLTLDSSIVQRANVTTGLAQTYNATGLVEGIHYWNATCWDGNNAVGQVNTQYTSETRNFSVSIPPLITLISPANGTITNNATRTFLFNVSDETGLTNCSILINGVINDTKATGQLILNGTNNFTVSGLNNTIVWAITCTDNSTAFAVNTSENRTLYVDLVAPLPVINTLTGLWFNTSSPSLNITVTDNFDTTLNWTFFVNDTVNTNGSATSNVSQLASLSGVTDGTHTVVLQAFDDAGNYANSTNITILVDTVAPNVTLLSPANGTNFSTPIVEMNFTATDALDTLLACNLTLDGAVVAQYNLSSGGVANYTSGTLTGGTHTWSAVCVDDARNRNVTETRQFFINLPDFAVLDIQVSNATPIENQTIEVNATVGNIGFINATGNITVQFWRGDPSSGGVQIGANITVQGLAMNENATVYANYTSVIGLNRIFVVIDPPMSTNGSYTETNETNNQLSYTFWVGLFEVFAGTSNNDLRIADNSIVSAFTWNQTDVNGSNVFVTDSESSVTFTSLYAIGRNTTNGTTVGANDFVEIDTRLNATALNDSVNLTFTAGGQPIDLVNLTAYKRLILDVPSVNSTNTTAFRTGILWDSSDGGGFYNGSQDIVFVTVMNPGQQGYYGTYDYEIKIPATLRNYVAGGGTVTFYTELR